MGTLKGGEEGKARTGVATVFVSFFLGGRGLYHVLLFVGSDFGGGSRLGVERPPIQPAWRLCSFSFSFSGTRGTMGSDGKRFWFSTLLLFLMIIDALIGDSSEGVPFSGGQGRRALAWCGVPDLINNEKKEKKRKEKKRKFLHVSVSSSGTIPSDVLTLLTTDSSRGGADDDDNIFLFPPLPVGPSRSG